MTISYVPAILILGVTLGKKNDTDIDIDRYTVIISTK